jgi:hypothetical protein
LAFLQKQGLEALHRLAAGALPYDSFRELALAEQAIRVEAATAARLAKEAEEHVRKAAKEAEEHVRKAATQEKMKLALA